MKKLLSLFIFSFILSSALSLKSSVYINCAGDYEGNFVSDKNPPSWLGLYENPQIGKTSSYIPSDNSLLDKPDVLKTHRWGKNGASFYYEIGEMENGEYDCILHFAEVSSDWAEVGKRVFQAEINNQGTRDIDVFDSVGIYEYYPRFFDDVYVSDNMITVRFFSINKGNPMISGISCEKKNYSSPPPKPSTSSSPTSLPESPLVPLEPPGKFCNSHADCFGSTGCKCHCDFKRCISYEKYNEEAGYCKKCTKDSDCSSDTTNVCSSGNVAPCECDSGKNDNNCAFDVLYCGQDLKWEGICWNCYAQAFKKAADYCSFSENDSGVCPVSEFPCGEGTCPVSDLPCDAELVTPSNVGGARKNKYFSFKRWRPIK